MKKFFSSLISPFLNAWHNLPLNWKGLITTVLPITAIIVSSLFAYLGNRSREAIETDIQRRFELASSLNDVLTLMVNAETGVRGYQLTKRQEFLEPFTIAERDLPEKLQLLQNLIEAEPGAKPRAEKLDRLGRIRDLIKKQMDDLTWQKDNRAANEKLDEEIYAHIMTGKRYMDEIRNILGRMETRESELLSERLTEINSIRRRDYLVVIITLAVALLTRILSWYLFDTGIRQKVKHAVERLRKFRNATDTPENHKDEMDMLEDEVIIICGPPTSDTETSQSAER